MVEVHKILIGYECSKNNMLSSTIGKNIESYKVQIKKLEKSYKNLLYKNDKNDAERIIISEGKIMLSKARKSIRYIYDNNYISVIERSMNREEICLGRGDSGNLRRKSDIIEIGTDKNMAYDLVEEDLYRYIKRLQKKKVSIDEEELIKLFVHSSHLSMSSIRYLNGLCNYPRDFLKAWERYIENKKSREIEEFVDSLNSSIIYESKSLIN